MVIVCCAVLWWRMDEKTVSEKLRIRVVQFQSAKIAANREKGNNLQ